ncbi:hypothetical protein [Lysinibacillus sp. NPDC096259]|uniref:hypothetical protein n=1 Tax=Lysinibacillus sp. NPDC096259 TaxID=3390583 RepID=UPI003CFD6909
MFDALSAILTLLSAMFATLSAILALLSAMSCVPVLIIFLTIKIHKKDASQSNFAKHLFCIVYAGSTDFLKFNFSLFFRQGK